MLFAGQHNRRISSGCSTLATLPCLRALISGSISSGADSPAWKGKKLSEEDEVIAKGLMSERKATAEEDMVRL
jgi:hypothetical protein